MSRGPDGAVAVHRTPVRIHADPSRVLARPFVPGQDFVAHGASRAGLLLDRVLALPEPEVEAVLAATLARFADRHRDLDAVLAAHYDLVAHRLADPAAPSAARRRLIGAYFTAEFAVEGAAVMNPSPVPHPDQRGVEAGGLRFVMSLRAVGEGHVSAVELRTGVVTAGGEVRIDDPGPCLAAGRPCPPRHDRELIRAKLSELGECTEGAAAVLDSLPATFGPADLDRALAAFAHHPVVAPASLDRLLRVVSSSYTVDFPAESALSERVLTPRSPAESRGLEDVRLVRFVDDDGAATYYGTYTAFDGATIASHLFETRDFTTFRSQPLVGAGARDKGVALFPRRVGGRFAALTRSDRESNGVAFSDRLTTWGEPVVVEAPERPWGLVNLGNCGSPLETEAGWLVLTHGVGPVRSYSMGALLLDLADPRRVVARLEEPLLCPEETEREGYVPNVVYSCGALAHGDTLVLPYGISDASVGVAILSLDELLGAMRPVGDVPRASGTGPA